MLIVFIFKERNMQKIFLPDLQVLFFTISGNSDVIFVCLTALLTKFELFVLRASWHGFQSQRNSNKFTKFTIKIKVIQTQDYK